MLLLTKRNYAHIIALTTCKRGENMDYFNIWQYYYDNMNKLDEITRRFSYSLSPEEQYQVLLDYYQLAKDFSVNLYSPECHIHESYRNIRNDIHNLEHLLPNDYIIDFSIPSFQEYPVVVDASFSDEDILDYIVSRTREELYASISPKVNSTDFKYFDLIRFCKDASEYAASIANELGLKSRLMHIRPGYSPRINMGCHHFFLIIIIKDTPYLIDCTYSQFFMRKRCIIEKLGVMYAETPSAGTFMVMDEERKSVAKTLLSRGWIKLDSRTLKHYLDGFTISYRNGLFYESTHDFSYTSPYSSRDYLNFLENTDDQVKHEGLENLGYQMRPLKNPNMKFPH